MKHYKRAFSTLTCIEAQLGEVVDYAVRHGFSAVELRMDPKLTVCGLGINDAKTVRDAFADAGIAVSDLASGVTVVEKSDAVYETAKACLDFAALIGAKGMRVFLGRGTPLFSKPAEHDFDGIVEELCRICDYADEKGVGIWLETHSEFSTGASMREVLDAVRAKGHGANMRIIWDLIHSIEYKESPADTVKALGNDIVHIHLKDGVYTGDPDRTQYIHTRLGEGDMKPSEMLALLSETDFDGCLSLEWEAPWRKELKGVYADTDAVFDAYNHWLDEAEGNA
ncbi:MAG: sugar phosphate isomerase/epimerase [Clostridia bacterium]|nr:sugar phosphate isomerase/epimerase [Clostridia bacterium]